MSAHRRELGVRKSYWWIHRLAPNLTPASTGSASWCVRVRHRDRDGVRVPRHDRLADAAHAARAHEAQPRGACLARAPRVQLAR